MFHVPNKHRVRGGAFASDESAGNNGAFFVPRRPGTAPLKVIASDCVVQYHPPRSEYVNNHPFCLHLWRPAGLDLPLPPAWMVGIKSLTPAQVFEQTTEGA